jgi:transcriptional regulator with XRE-family HTH domain
MLACSMKRTKLELRGSDPYRKGQVMPPRGEPKRIGAEEFLARRVQYERERRGWTHTGLAKRISEAGCPMNQSALWKIENGEPRRRITVDEAVAFATVFEINVSELLADVDDVITRKIDDYYRAMTRVAGELSSMDERATNIATALDELRSIVNDTGRLDRLVIEALQHWESQATSLAVSRERLFKALANTLEASHARGL